MVDAERPEEPDRGRVAAMFAAHPDLDGRVATPAPLDAGPAQLPHPVDVDGLERVRRPAAPEPR